MFGPKRPCCVLFSRVGPSIPTCMYVQSDRQNICMHTYILPVQNRDDSNPETLHAKSRKVSKMRKTNRYSALSFKSATAKHFPWLISLTTVLHYSIRKNLSRHLNGRTEAMMAGLNKMFVMVPVMLAARQIDGEDPKNIFMIRVTYGVVQSLVLLVVFYVYIKASGSCQGMNQVVYVPPPPVVRSFVF